MPTLSESREKLMGRSSLKAESSAALPMGLTPRRMERGESHAYSAVRNNRDPSGEQSGGGTRSTMSAASSEAVGQLEV